MEHDEIMKEVNKIFIEVFEDNSIVLHDTTTTEDIPVWDSLNHIQMVTAVEKHFKIRFDLNELLNFKDVGDLCSGIKGKMK